MTPQARTRKLYEALGFTVAVVERWIPQAQKRIDAFGMFDLLAINGDFTIGIQATSASNVAARVKKMEEHPNLALWCAALGREAVVIGWGKTRKRGRLKSGKKAAGYEWTHRKVVIEPPGAARYEEAIG